MSFETRRAGAAINARLTELKAEERYARERYQLYKAKAYGSRLTSPGRLRDLERRSRLAKRRLDTALRNSREADHISVVTALGLERAATPLDG